jgi:hypothetical protein
MSMREGLVSWRPEACVDMRDSEIPKQLSGSFDVQLELVGRGFGLRRRSPTSKMEVIIVSITARTSPRALAARHIDRTKSMPAQLCAKQTTRPPAPPPLIERISVDELQRGGLASFFDDRAGSVPRTAVSIANSRFLQTLCRKLSRKGVRGSCALSLPDSAYVNLTSNAHC